MLLRTISMAAKKNLLYKEYLANRANHALLGNNECFQLITTFLDRASPCITLHLDSYFIKEYR